ncbi:hypothetical protein P4K96_29050 [Bacillus cereus]|uniref:hypothetical protein n=1 Tax=Paenibacillus melissococcoides TaxID=2912268 RepID=UPI002DD15D9C|nr:hypothetical protein [Bacillus cereus]
MSKLEKLLALLKEQQDAEIMISRDELEGVAYKHYLGVTVFSEDGNIVLANLRKKIELSEDMIESVEENVVVLRAVDDEVSMRINIYFRAL